MNNKRPININPLSIELPIGAKVSITHRVAGVLVFVLIPFLLCALQQSLASPAGFLEAKATFKTPFGMVILWAFLAGFFFHFFAGIRHLLMDVHLGESLKVARKSAFLVFVLSLAVWLAVFWLWGRA